MSLQDPYPIQPWSAPCRGSVRLPGSKSLTNRALIIAALTNRKVVLRGALFSRDSALLVDNLRRLGYRVEDDPSHCTITVHGQSGRIPVDQADLFVGNAGTAARFLTAFVCLHPSGTFTFDGDPEMRERPMAGLIAALERIGARFIFAGKEGHFPFTVQTHGLKAGDWEVEANASSQMLSALMMVAPLADGGVLLHSKNVRPAFVDMTARMMRQFGAQIYGNPENGFETKKLSAYELPGEDYAIEPDVTAASYFMVLPFVAGGSLQIEGMPSHSLQGDVAFADVLRSLGFEVNNRFDRFIVAAPQGLDNTPRSFSFERFSDTFLTLAAVAPLFPFPIEITGIEHTRYQETDRVKAMTTELRRIGVTVLERPDSLLIHPLEGKTSSLPRVCRIETYKDHRVAMAFGILGCHDRFRDGSPWIEIRDPSCCGKTFPDFFQCLNNLYLKCHDRI